MRNRKTLLFLFLVLMAGLIIIVSCSTMPFLSVNYQAGSKKETLKGKRAYLKIIDSRANKEILGKKAKKEFPNFSKSISLSVSNEGEPVVKVGVFEFQDFAYEIFKRRLESYGLRVSSKEEQGLPGIEIDISLFYLEIDNRKWKGDMVYEAKLVKDGREIVNHRVKGEAERLKIIGWKQADQVVSEMVTDLANRLDAAGLLEQAGL